MARKKGNDSDKQRDIPVPSAERIQEELAKAEPMDDFFGRGF